jgi:hypothetical protein
MSFLAYGSPINSADDLIGLVAVTGGLTVGLLTVLLCTIRGILRTRAREQTKREIAAYVAEGSIRAEDAERILKADLKPWECARDRSC